MELRSIASMLSSVSIWVVIVFMVQQVHYNYFLPLRYLRMLLNGRHRLIKKLILLQQTFLEYTYSTAIL